MAEQIVTEEPQGEEVRTYRTCADCGTAVPEGAARGAQDGRWTCAGCFGANSGIRSRRPQVG